MTTQMNYDWLRNEDPKKTSFQAQVDPRLFSSEDPNLRKYTKQHMLSLYNPLENAEFVSEIRTGNKSINSLDNKKSFMQSESFSDHNNNNNLNSISNNNDTSSDVPLWAGVSKDDIGSFDTNGVYHLGEAETDDSLEPQHSNATFNEHIELFKNGNDNLFSEKDILQRPGKRDLKKNNSFDHQQAFMLFGQQQRGPESHQWVYRDPSGHIQGPFSSLEMQEWYQSGYFDLSLMVKREDSPFFEPLAALVNKVNNLKTPFLSTWPIMQPPPPPPPPPLSFFQNNMRPSLSTPIHNGFNSTYPISPVEENKNDSNAFMNKNNFSIRSFNHLPTSPPLLPPIVQSPSSSLSAQTNTRMFNPNSFVRPPDSTLMNTHLGHGAPQPIGNLVHDPWMVDPATASIFGKPKPQQQKMYVEEEDTMINNAILNQQEIEQRYLQILRQNQQQQQHFQLQQQRLLRQKNNSMEHVPSHFDQTLSHPNLFDGMDQITHSISNLKLKHDLQKEEKEEVMASKKESLWSSSISKTPLKDEHPFISKNNQQLATQKPSPPQVTTSFSANTATRVQPKSNLWGASGRPKRVSMTGGAPIAQKPIVDETRTQSDNLLPSQEFCKWCKVSLRGLDSGVNVDEILQMLLSFPVDEESSMEIIQDIIYANSASMDGRRFASDFMKRRKADMKGELDALLPKAILSEQDNSFKVVTTKKGRKKYHH